MSLLLKNPRIYDFYKNNPQYDFEKMNHLLVDLLEKFQEKINPAFDQSFATRLLEQMGEIQKQLMKQQTDQQLEYYKQLGEIRKQHLDEMQTLVANHHNEKVQPFLTQYTEQLYEKISLCQRENPLWETSIANLKQDIQNVIQNLSAHHGGTSSMGSSSDMMNQYVRTIEDKFSQNFTSFQTFTNQMIMSTENRLRDDLRMQQHKIEDMSQRSKDQEHMHNQVNELLRKMDNSSSKGKISETMLSHVLNQMYPMGDIQSVGTTKETGDFMMKRDNKPTILFENKNYDRNVGQEEVQKFLRDVDTQQCAGILLAQHYGIANKSNYEIHLYQGKVCVYLHQVNYSPEKIKIAVDIIDHLSHFIDASGFKSEAITVDKEFLDQINKEYQSFAQQKMTQLKTIKEYSAKLTSQLDEMKMPQLEQWLCKYYSHSFSKDNQCIYCGFEAKSSGGLTSHLRSCVAKKKSLESTTIGENQETANSQLTTVPMPIKPNKPTNPFFQTEKY
jgi:hypothetical protein